MELNGHLIRQLRKLLPDQFIYLTILFNVYFLIIDSLLHLVIYCKTSEKIQIGITYVRNDIYNFFLFGSHKNK